MFKIGDVVKCVVPPYGSSRLTKGKTYVVQSGRKNPWVEVIGDDGNKWSFYARRFELADPMASMSDQQLADKYRKMVAEGKKVFDELRRRGYTVSSISYGNKN